MNNKISPRRVRICPGCPNNDLNLDTVPKFKFINKIQEESKIITIVGQTKNKISSKIKSLF